MFLCRTIAQISYRLNDVSDKERADQYNVIKQYDVSKYNEKPFETE